MEQENFNEEIESDKKNPLFQVTTLSKYLALILFILMPFIGGWIGYTYAPERVVEVEKIVIKEISPEESATGNQYEQSVDVFAADGRYAPDGKPLSDVELYEQTNFPFVTTFSKDYALYSLGRDGASTLYKYNSDTHIYEPLDIDLVAEASKINSLSGASVIGWSDDWQYVMFRTVPYEGFDNSDVYYIDTLGLDKGFVYAPSHFVTGGNEQVSPDKTRVLGVYGESKIISIDDTKNYKDTGAGMPQIEYEISYIPEKSTDLAMFDINTLQVKSIYELKDDEYNFHYPFGFGYYINATWSDQSTVELKTSNRENFESLESNLITKDEFESLLNARTINLQ